MKLSKEDQKNLKEGKVTMQMLGAAAYSYNKRAKNYRDKAEEIHHYYRNNRYTYDKYNSEEKARMQMDAYYCRKDECLSLMQPTEVHKVIRSRREFKYHDPDDGPVFSDTNFAEYYILYRAGTYSFHHPITEEKYNELSKTLPEKQIDLYTDGKYTDELMSVKTADKIRRGLLSGDYKLI